MIEVEGYGDLGTYLGTWTLPYGVGHNYLDLQSTQDHCPFGLSF